MPDGQYNPWGRIPVRDLINLVEVSYEANQRRSLRTLIHQVKPLLRKLGDLPIEDCSWSRVERYKVERLEEGAAPATINNELAYLRRGFKLAQQERRRDPRTGLLFFLVPPGWAPKIDGLRVENVREGFLEPEDLEEICRELRSDVLRDVCRFLYHTGWRKSEALKLEWAHVEPRSRRVRVTAKNSKNTTHRVAPITGVIAEILARRAAARTYQAQSGVRLASPWVFHRRGSPIKDFRWAWQTATIRAGHEGVRVHDFRRSFCRNAVLAGVPRDVAMKLSGHKTDSVFRRYVILQEADLLDAHGKIEAYLRRREV